MGPDTARERLNSDALDAASGTMVLTRSSIERLNLETGVERRTQCDPWCAEQGVTRRNEPRLLRRVTTPLCAPRDALRTS